MKSACFCVGDRTMLQFLILMIFGCLGTSSAATTNTKSSSLLSCTAVRGYFEAEGFPASDIPRQPISSRELKTCGSTSSGGEACCTADMELRLQARAREKHDKATRDILQRFHNILYTRAIRFHDFFNELLKTSKRNFHEMFKKTYGILYEQNAYVFIDLFRELEKYYAKGSVDLDNVMDTFFNTLYQKMFTVLNSQYKFDNKYLQCVGHHMKEMKPFGDVPQKLGVQIKRSFIATRAFSQALQVAAEVLKKMQQLSFSSECVTALTRMTACPSCRGISGSKLACNNLCENVMKGCLAQHAALDTDWNHFVDAVDKVADRLLGPFNIEMLVRPISLKISEAIMNFQESSNDVSQRVFTGCGRPVLGRRRRKTDLQELKEIDETRSLNFDENPDIPEDNQEIDQGLERSSTADILDKLVKEIKQRIRDSRQFWLYLPYKLCSDGLVAPPSNTKDCWNGTHIDKYIYPLSSNGESQGLNPEVRVIGPQVPVVRTQLFALNTISNRLRSAFNGHDVDWIDVEEIWSSGSGSGSSSVDPITDDEDGFAEEGSGYDDPSKHSIDFTPHSNRPKDHESVELPVTTTFTSRIDMVDNGSNRESDRGIISNSNSGLELDLDFDAQVNITRTPIDTGTADISGRMSLTRALTSYFLPIVVVWFGGCLTEWL